MKSKLIPFLILSVAGLSGCSNENASTKKPTPGVIPGRAATGSPSTSDPIREEVIKLILADHDERDESGKLISITLAQKDVKLADLAALDEAKTIQKLYAGHVGLTDADLAFLPKLEGLKLIEFNVNGKITDEGLKHLAGLQQLRVLSLFYCPMLTGEGFAHLKSLDKLVILDIGNNKNITDDSLKHLKELDSLQDLRASPLWGLTDEGLKHLAELTQLKRLTIGSKNFTDQGLASLSTLKKLEQLSLSQCTKITDEGVDRLRYALPDCKIVHSK